MKAIIVAAGKSTRLYPMTLDKPKCLLEIGTTTMLEHQIKILQACGVNDIVVILGYLKEKIMTHIGNKVRYREFDDFAKGNNLLTLHSARDELNDDCLVLFADVLLEKELLQKLLDSTTDFSLLVHNKEILKDTMRVKIIEDSICDIGGHIPIEVGHGNFIGIAKYSKRAAELLARKMEQMVHCGGHTNDYYTQSLVPLAANGEKITPIYANDDLWVEIDHMEDYERAKKLFGDLV
jgi:L-glutamine-phosphate cytidylyltransferase